MKIPTNQHVIISISEMETLIQKMKENQDIKPGMSSQVKLSLCIDSDYKCHRIDTTKPGEQFASYQECNSLKVDIKAI